MKKALIGVGVGLAATIATFITYMAVVVAKDERDMFDEDDWLD